MNVAFVLIVLANNTKNNENVSMLNLVRTNLRTPQY